MLWHDCGHECMADGVPMVGKLAESPMLWGSPQATQQHQLRTQLSTLTACMVSASALQHS